MTKKNTHKEVLINFIIGCFVVFQLASCATIKPVPPGLEYFQANDSIYPAYIQTIVPQIARIQPGDILGIIVSSLNKEANETLNLFNTNSLPQATFTPGGGGGGGEQPLGYPVDSLGNVFMPFIGRQKIAGLTLHQAEEKIRIEIDKTLKSPTVNIRFINHKFTVLGEVNRVGTFNLLNDQTTIIEAITAAGDLTVFAKRDSINVIRIANGKRELGRVSLRNREVFASPYFYIRNDDIIYVEPIKEKTVPAPPPPTSSLFVQRVPVYLSLVSTLLSLYLLLSRI